MANTTDTIAQLEATKKELLERVSQIDLTINTLNAMSSFSVGSGNHSNLNVPNKIVSDKYSDYNTASAIKNKLAFILKKENRFLHTRQIAEIMNQNEPHITVKDFITKLYPAIADLKKLNALVKVSVGNSNVNTFWGSKNWIDENGTIKKEYMYDESQITNFGAEEIDI